MTLAFLTSESFWIVLLFGVGFGVLLGGIAGYGICRGAFVDVLKYLKRTGGK